MDAFEGAKPKDGSTGKLFTKENIKLLTDMFPDKDANTLSAFLYNYPGGLMEGLVERILECDSKIQCAICWEDFDIEDSISCNKGHLFCRSCAKTGVEVQIKEGIERYVCFAQNCNLEFDLPVMQSLLEPKWLSKLVQKLCLSEVQKCSNLQMEYCPQCNFGMSIEDPNIQVIECKYEYCRVVSCRNCKKPAHRPGEMCVTEENLRRDHKIENILTEAVVRKCSSCFTPFQKFEGCNRIQCRCGAQMCYVCKKTIQKNCDHFYNTNEIPRMDQCPLQSNPEDLHKMERATAAKGAVSLLDPSNSLQLSNNPLFKD